MHIAYVFPFNEIIFFAACWDPNPHLRPLFDVILGHLDHIVHSTFLQTPHESFHTMQDGWKVEIEEVLLGLRNKEKVSNVVIAV